MKSDGASQLQTTLSKEIPANGLTLGFHYEKVALDRDSLISCEIKKCNNGAQAFALADSMLLNLLGTNRRSTKTVGSWNYPNLAESIYNREGYVWDLKDEFTLSIGWDNTDTNCVIVFYGPNSDEGE